MSDGGTAVSDYECERRWQSWPLDISQMERYIVAVYVTRCYLPMSAAGQSDTYHGQVGSCWQLVRTLEGGIL